MREILFRAFVKDNGKIYSIKKIDFDYRIVWFEEENKATDTMRIFDQIELMQFTGLTDKNGKKIFEGDIVKIHRKYLNAGYEEDCYYKVAWHKYWDGWALINLKPTQSCYLESAIFGEVIGNIHDNPELLEKTNEN